VLLALLAGGAFWAYYSLDVIVRMALERYGPDVLGASVKVGDVRISPKTGEGSVSGLEIGTPRGFSARAARFGEVRIALDPATIASDVVHVREVSISSPSISYERGKGATNLDAIQKNIDAYIHKTAAPEEAKGGGRSSKRRFVVDRLAIRGAKVTMTNPALRGQGVTFDLPDIELRDIGKRQNGLRASEIANIVASALISRIAQKLLTNIDLLRRGGVEGAVDALKGLLK
jgi:uncharacterized protein involved in outer membrane biogenesis